MKRITLNTVALMAMFVLPLQDINAQRHDDIVNVARDAGQFTTLLAALDAAGLTHTLAGGGPFTVFAPTDEAFAALPAGTVESLLERRNLGRLQEILKYHVVSGRVSSSQVKNLRSATTLADQRISITHRNGTIGIDESTVVAADIRASNGVIHIIDRVLLPETATIPEIASDAGTFTTLLAAVTEAGLAETLMGEGPFTVFAPTDEAFAALPAGTVESLLREENRAQLIEILTYHVVSGRVYADQALEARRATTLAGGPVRVRVADGGVRVNDSRVIATDIQASNGVIHVIDAVLLPPENMGAIRGATALIELAISRGAPLFNQGQEEACVAIYEIAATALLQMGDVIPADARHELRRALDSRRSHAMRNAAWALREALDETMRLMESRMDTMAAR